MHYSTSVVSTQEDIRRSIAKVRFVQLRSVTYTSYITGDTLDNPDIHDIPVPKQLTELVPDGDHPTQPSILPTLLYVENLSQLNNLTALTLTSCRLYEANLACLSKFINLQCLKLSYYNNANDEPLDQALQPLLALPLRQLHLRSVDISPLTMTTLRNNESLRELTLDECRGGASVLDEYLPQLIRLEYLVIYPPRRILLGQDAFQLADVTLQHLLALPDMTALRVPLSVPQCRLQWFDQFSQAPGLTSLILSGDSSFGAGAVTALCDALHNLQTLELPWPADINDDDLLVLCTQLKSLRRLVMASNTVLTDAGMAHLQHCKHLQHLALGRAPFLTNAGLLEVRHITTLTSLSVQFATGCHDDLNTLTQILDACPSIRALRIRCPTGLVEWLTADGTVAALTNVSRLYIRNDQENTPTPPGQRRSASNPHHTLVMNQLALLPGLRQLTYSFKKLALTDHSSVLTNTFATARQQAELSIDVQLFTSDGRAGNVQIPRRVEEQ